MVVSAGYYYILFYSLLHHLWLDSLAWGDMPNIYHLSLQINFLFSTFQHIWTGCITESISCFLCLLASDWIILIRVSGRRSEACGWVSLGSIFPWFPLSLVIIPVVVEFLYWWSQLLLIGLSPTAIMLSLALVNIYVSVQA